MAANSANFLHTILMQLKLGCNIFAPVACSCWLIGILQHEPTVKTNGKLIVNVVVPEILTAEGSPGPKRRSFAEKNDMDDLELGIANFELLDAKVICAN